jgi:transposase
MKNAQISHRPSTDFVSMSKEELVALCGNFQQQIHAITQQLDWFKRQLFGQKSEKRDFAEVPQQVNMAELFGKTAAAPAEPPKETITYQRGKALKNRLENTQEDNGLRFDDSVPVKEIQVLPAELKGADKDLYEIVDTKTTCRLAQQPASYVVLKYVHPVIKEKSTQTLINTQAPANVLDKSIADVSLLAGLLIDKFLYHLPLYRQHQRIEACGIQLARSSLTNWVKRAIELLRPIYNSQLEHILLSKILAIDETPIKAGREQKGKLKQGYFWPIFGDHQEICFTFSSSRAQKHLFDSLGKFSGTLLSDGYSAYANYAKANDNTRHAQCWVHTRRKFEETIKTEPIGGAAALDYIGALYGQEKTIREKALSETQALAHRQQYSQPIVDAFFAWVWEQRQRMDLLPNDPFTKALQYAHNREHALRVFLTDANVPLDTNHVERALRVVPMGRKNWLFAWTEIGAEHIGIIQSLLSTCKLHNVNPYDYLVDVLQRVDRHPASQVEELTPRLWKNKFAENALRSDVQDFRNVI